MKESGETLDIVGLDIGNSKVCAVAGHRDEEGRICILNYAESGYDSNYEAMDKGLVKNRDNTLKAINKVLGQIAQTAGLNINKVNCAYSNGQIGMQSVRAEVTKNGNKFTMNPDELQTLMKLAQSQLERDEKMELLHCLPTDFFIDEEKIKMPMGVNGNKLSSNFNGIMNPSRLVREFVDSINGMEYGYNEGRRREKGNKVHIGQLIYSGMADALACLSDEDRRAGILLINMGAHLTQFSIYKDTGLRYTRVIELGARSVIGDIAHAFQLTEDRAKRLLLGSCDKMSHEIEINEVLELEGKNGLPHQQYVQAAVAKVIECRIKEIAALISSDVLESGYAGMLANGVMITGASAWGGITRKIFDKTFDTLNTRVANPTLNIDRNTKLELANPKYSTAIGAMLSGLHSLDVRIPERNGTKSKKWLSPMSIFGNFGNTSEAVNNIKKKIFDDTDLRKSYEE